MRLLQDLKSTMFSTITGLIIYINNKSYIKYEKYKYIVIEFWDTINWIHTKTIDYTQE